MSRAASAHEKTFTLYWRDGLRQTVTGRDIADAMTNAGYGAGALAALDFHASGDNHDWTYNQSTREWDDTSLGALTPAGAK